jgi:hypothetical protein
LDETDYDKIIVQERTILPEGNKVKENIYSVKSMIRPFGLGYHKIDICPNFCILYYNKNIDFAECRTCGHSRYKPKTGREMTLVA